MASNLIFLLTITSFFVVSLQHRILTPMNNRSSRHFGFTETLLGSQKGDTVEGINKLKQYLQRFGYLVSISSDELDDSSNISYDNYFDKVTEAALKAYQINHSLKPTGILDSGTLETITGPRCGVPDDPVTGSETSIGNRTYCNGKTCIRFGSHYRFWGPKWPVSRFHLTYGFGNNFPSIGIEILAKSFSRWASVSKFTFTEIKDYNSADVKVSFQKLDHGDGLPFDGPGGILGHAFAPQDGRMHFDGDETWSEGAYEGAIDLGTVALHEIGHVLGLLHSKDKNAIMWPGIPLGASKDLNQDDIDGIQALYP